jgi:hypothetical protein
MIPTISILAQILFLKRLKISPKTTILMDSNSRSSSSSSNNSKINSSIKIDPKPRAI